MDVEREIVSYKHLHANLLMLASLQKETDTDKDLFSAFIKKIILILNWKPRNENKSLLPLT